VVFPALAAWFLKSESSAVIAQAVRAAVTGSPAFSPELSARILTLPNTPTAETEDVPITVPEQQLLQFLCADKSNREIAETLHLSRKTVEKRLTALYKKLGVKTRTGAAAWYLEHDK
jgi:DNA-binding NarL/FixJ family response regulator